MKQYQPKASKQVAVEVLITMRIDGEQITDENGEDCTTRNIISCTETEIMDQIEVALEDYSPVYQNFTVSAVLLRSVRNPQQ